MAEGTTTYSPTILARHARATVVGLGATGFSVVRYLCARGISVTVVDSRPEPPNVDELKQSYEDVSIKSGTLNVPEVTQATLIVLSPGVSRREPVIKQAQRNGAEVVGDIELFFQENSAPVVAITGSNGKSTVTSLVGEMIRCAGKTPLIAGNIGRPVLDALTDNEKYDVAVLELSSFQLETTSQVPAKSVAILNISEDHMDRYDSMGDYTLAKARILRGAERAVLPRHDERLTQITQTSELLTFGLDQPSADNEYGVVRGKSGRWLMQGQNKLMLLRDINLVGLHNVENVLSAFALLKPFDLPLNGLVEAVKSFEGLDHRMQTVAKFDDLTWVNDSKATNVGAASAALKNVEGDVVWLAGGVGKDADFTPLKHAITGNLRHVILFGEDANQISDVLPSETEVSHVENMAEAVLRAKRVAPKGSTILLSPACASFDMFSNFEQRGLSFVKAVEHLKSLSGEFNG